ncbi:PhoH family protein [Candidatus Saccharibacteria bacterium]|nr:PhoH family protein [Candidatus Saccharibacteria bacterium]
MQRPIYVVDTNILVDYVEIVPNGNGYQPENPTVDLSHAHIVIPTAVIRELSHFKGEKSDRGKAAREALRRIRHLVEKDIKSIGEVYNLKAPIHTLNGDQLISVLPVHQDFSKSLPFRPSDTDMDGQIILATLVVGFIINDIPIDGTAKPTMVADYVCQDITLLTNDNGLAIRARERGIKTQRYGYKYPEPYTGRREVIVPRDLFWDFYDYGEISVVDWEIAMPKQPPLVANEFIVMKLADELDYPSDFDFKYNSFFSHIGRFDAHERTIVKLQHVKEFPIRLKNDGQAIYAEALMNPDIAAVICTGPAGSGKTYMATVYGYHACKNGDFIGVTVVPCDSKSKLGALPGDLDEKMDPEVQPIKNSLRNYLINEEAKFHKEMECLKKFGPNDKPKCAKEDSAEKRSIKARLKDRVDMIWDNWFSNIPIENARGRDFSYELAIYDEFQDQSVSQADTLIKRLGTEGKIIITGDIEQIHAPYIDSSSSGLVYASKQLKDSPMVAQVNFTEAEVIRHPLVRMIAKRQKDSKAITH